MTVMDILCELAGLYSDMPKAIDAVVEMEKRIKALLPEKTIVVDERNTEETLWVDGYNMAINDVDKALFKEKSDND